MLHVSKSNHLFLRWPYLTCFVKSFAFSERILLVKRGFIVKLCALSCIFRDLCYEYQCYWVVRKAPRIFHKFMCRLYVFLYLNRNFLEQNEKINFDGIIFRDTIRDWGNSVIFTGYSMCMIKSYILDFFLKKENNFPKNFWNIFYNAYLCIDIDFIVYFKRLWELNAQ